jgi:molybdopterin-biosynthesis enzyme MoeA-like protein
MTVCYSIIESFSLSHTPLNTTDITYKSLAKSFNQKLAHHQETIRRMSAMNKNNRKWVGTQNPEQLAATHRMALFPESAEVIYVEKDVWVVRKHPFSSSGDAAH